MKTVQMIFFSAMKTDLDVIRKEASKLAKMYLDAELEEDFSKQEEMLIAAEKFSEQLELKYADVDEETYEAINLIMDEEADKVSQQFFDGMIEEDDEK
jgi:hypothetical protein